MKKKLIVTLLSLVLVGTFCILPVRAAPFDAAYYAEHNPDVVAALGNSEEALLDHYNTFGKGEGRRANSTDFSKLNTKDVEMLKEMFDAKYYAEKYPDVAKECGTDEEKLFNHFLNNGLVEGRQPSKDFNVYAYKSCYADLNKTFEDDVVAYYKHYLNYGRKENREMISLEMAARKGIKVTDFKGKEIGATAVTSQTANYVLASVSPSATPTPTAIASPTPTATPTATLTPCLHQKTLAKNKIDKTCYEDGTTGDIYCANCGVQVKDSTIDPCTGHIGPFTKNESGHVCQECGSTIEHTDAYQSNRNGTHKHYCGVCGYVFAEKESCTMSNDSCSKCGYGCKHLSTITRNIVDATCIEAGYTGDKYCQNCNKLLASGSEISALGHDWKDGICQNNANCVCPGHVWQEDGENMICSVCGKICGHVWNATTGKCDVCDKVCAHAETMVEAGVDATCEKAGKTGNTVCTTCGYVITKGTTIPATGHDWSNKDGICVKCRMQCEHAGNVEGASACKTCGASISN